MRSMNSKKQVVDPQKTVERLVKALRTREEMRSGSCDPLYLVGYLTSFLEVTCIHPQVRKMVQMRLDTVVEDIIK